MNEYTEGIEKQNEELKEKLSKFEGRNLVSIPTLKNEYCDVDYVLIHAIFALLVKFIENEWGGVCNQYDDETINYESDENAKETLRNQNKDKKELFELYLWWKNEFPELEKDPKWHIEGYETETNKAMRVVELRRYMWT